jgi:hypothetical protein
MPAAPYPPMINSTRFPSAQLSSLVSPSSSSHQPSSLVQQPQGAATGATTASLGGADFDSPAHAQQQQPILSKRGPPPRVKFCRYDLLACINCSDDLDPLAAADEEEEEDARRLKHQTAMSITGAAADGRRLGPLLLDLRRLDLATTNSRIKQQGGASGMAIFDVQTLGRSRGNPSLGTTVASTCLDVLSNAASTTTSDTVVCVTGLTTGALCVHTFEFPAAATAADTAPVAEAAVEYYHTPRNHRPATAVAVRPASNQVAIGLKAAAATTAPSDARRPRGPGGVGASPAAVGGMGHHPVLSGGGGGGVDREYCCFVWDVEHQSGITRRSKPTPLYRLSHKAGVASLSWILEGGSTLVVGEQQRNMQLYDMRCASSSSTPPLTVFSHSFGVHGIEADPSRPWHFATFSRSNGEPVKLWDARRMDSPVTEIKTGSGKSGDASVTSIRWSTLCPGHLSIVAGNEIIEYDASSSGARPIHINTIYTPKPIVDFTHFPFPGIPIAAEDKDEAPHKKIIFARLFSKRIVGVDTEHVVSDIPAHRLAPVVISQRTGQVLNSLGHTLWSTSVSEGPAAMESRNARVDEDISATMVRRARCIHVTKYSMDTVSNIKTLTTEISEMQGDSMPVKTSIGRLLRLWRWIQRVEAVCGDLGNEDSEMTSRWNVKGLIDAGAMNLLRIDEGKNEVQSFSDSLSCATYDSEGRR